MKYKRYILLIQDPISFRLYTDSKDSAYGSTFMVSPPNSIYRRVYKKNMDKTSFTGFNISYGLSTILTNPKTAFYGNCGYIYRSQEYKSCQVSYGTFCF